MLTTKELAKELKVSEITLWRWRSEGMPFKKLSSKTFRYELKDVEKWLENRQ